MARTKNAKKHGNRRQGIFWMLTIPRDAYEFPTELPSDLAWIKGQVEQGNGETAYVHWQLLCAFRKKASLKNVKSLFGRKVHAELSRSEHADAYVCKDETRISGPYELGAKPFRRNNKRDWEQIWESAKTGELDKIPADVRVVSYRTLRSIAADYDSPREHLRVATVYYGPTGTGKSFSAWHNPSGFKAYSKDPRSKFFCGYQGQEDIVMDEFRGGIDISHLLRWFDEYPVRIEIKGSSCPLVGIRWWITSNLHPREWYSDLDSQTYEALMRRIRLIHCPERGVMLPE